MPACWSWSRKVPASGSRTRPHALTHDRSCPSRLKRSAEAALHHLREIMGKLKLTVNEEKTRICKVPDDFREIARVVDPYIDEKGKLSGLLVEAESFPGWEGFGALLEHMR